MRVHLEKQGFCKLAMVLVGAGESLGEVGRIVSSESALSKRYSIEEILRLNCEPNTYMNDFREWVKTESGKQWIEWYNQKDPE